MKFKKAVLATLGAAVLATSTLGSIAHAAPAPKDVALRLGKKQTTCPAPHNMMLYVSGTEAGWVQFRIERKSTGTFGPIQWLELKKARANSVNKDKYRGKIRVKPIIPPGVTIDEKFRAHVAGNGKVKKSAWARLRIDC